jgi:hypothetical protein
MSIEHYTPFLVLKGGETDKIITSILAQKQVSHDAAVAFCNRYGADSYLGSNGGGNLYGLVFPHGATIPEGLIKKTKQGHTYYVAGKRGDRAKAIRAEIEALPTCINASFNGLGAQIGCELTVYGNIMRSAYCDQIGDDTIVLIPNNPDTNEPDIKEGYPKDCKQLRLSEYYGMKERADQKAVAV